MKRLLGRLPLWLIPLMYAAVTFVAALTLPRFENVYFASYASGLSVASAQSFFAAVASGMIALTGIVFSVGLVMVQFSAMAYSPRLVLMFARDPMLFHSLGVFIATCLYSLGALAWVDREGSGIVPLFSGLLVVSLLSLSMLLFSRLIKGLSDLQITNVLHLLGDQGREIVRASFQRLDEKADGKANVASEAAGDPELGPVIQTLIYSDAPLTIVRFDIDDLVRQARQAGAVIVMAHGVGDTLVADTTVLRVHCARAALPESDLMRCIHLGSERTAEQDPKYPIRLRRYPRPSMIRQRRSRRSIRSRICCGDWDGANWTPATPGMRGALCASYFRCRRGRTIWRWRSKKFASMAPARSR